MESDGLCSWRLFYKVKFRSLSNNRNIKVHYMTRTKNKSHLQKGSKDAVNFIFITVLVKLRDRESDLIRGRHGIEFTGRERYCTCWQVTARECEIRVLCSPTIFSTAISK